MGTKGLDTLTGCDDQAVDLKRYLGLFLRHCVAAFAFPWVPGSAEVRDL